MMKDYAMNSLVYPKTTDNNGFFQCLITKTNYNKQKGYKKAKTIRDELGIQKGNGISYHEMPRIVEYFSNELLKKPLGCRIFNCSDHQVLIEHNVNNIDAEVIEIYLGFNKLGLYKYAYVKNTVSTCKHCSVIYGNKTHPWSKVCWMEDPYPYPDLIYPIADRD